MDAVRLTGEHGASSGMVGDGSYEDEGEADEAEAAYGARK